MIIFLVILIYVVVSILISIPYYLSNYQITFINSIFESFSGITGTGFSIFDNVKYLDPTLLLWRSSSQWIGGLYFLIFLFLFFSNNQFNYKLTKLVYSDEKNLNIEAKYIFIVQKEHYEKYNLKYLLNLNRHHINQLVY